MADRDVILKALGDYCWSDEAPLHLAALDPRDLGRLAEVAAGAVAEREERLERVVTAARRVNNGDPYAWSDLVKRVAALDPPPRVGTQAEAQACAARSGVGEDC